MESNRFISQTMFKGFALAVVVAVPEVFAPILEQFGPPVGQAEPWDNQEAES